MVRLGRRVSTASCDTESLWAAMEMTVAGDIASNVQPLQLSETTGLLEPRLIKFLPQNAEQELSRDDGFAGKRRRFCVLSILS